MKTIVVASDIPLGAAVARRLAIGHHKALSSARQLGVDYASGRGLKTTLRRARLSAIRKRLVRFRTLRKLTSKRTAARVFKAAGTAGLTYAADVTGVPAALLGSYRTTAARVVSSSGKGASKTITMDLSPVMDYDPAYSSNVDPIARWARRAWAADAAMRSRIQRVWMVGTSRLRAPLLRSDQSALWKAVGGPSTALIATLARLGWRMHSAYVWTTHLGRRLDLLTLAPKAVAELARSATHDWLYRLVATTQPALALLRGGADVTATRKLTTGRTSRYWTFQHQRALVCAASVSVCVGLG